MNARYAVLGPLLMLTGCGPVEDVGGPADVMEQVDSAESALGRRSARSRARAQAQARRGVRIFDRRTFGGNGRTCATCHLPDTGTLSPADVQQAWADDPEGPLFRAIDSDDGAGESFERLRTHATIRVHLPLPANVRLLDAPDAREVVVNRGISATLDNPGIEDVFLQDGRAATLQEQALGAINAHFEPARQPTGAELDAIAAGQQRTRRFYSSTRLFRWGTDRARAPRLPRGRTASERRGRRFFAPGPDGLCTHCHGGPALNATTAFFAGPLPVGSRFVSAAVSEFNVMENPVLRFAFDGPDGEVIVESPDPGRALITGRLEDVNAFRIPTLWGVKHTAPYFHDNSAPDLEAMMEHYVDYFALPPANIELSRRDVRDIINYLELL